MDRTKQGKASFVHDAGLLLGEMAIERPRLGAEVFNYSGYD